MVYEELFLMFMGFGGVIGAALHWVFGFIMTKRWYYDVTIFEKRDNGYWTIRDQARKYTDKLGRQYFKLRKQRKNIKPIKYEDIQLSGKRGYLQVYSPNRDEFFATQFKELPWTPEEKAKLEKELAELCVPVGFAEKFNKGKLEIIPDDMKFWHINQVQAGLERFKLPKPWYMEPMFVGMMAIIVTGMMMAIILYMTTEKMGGISNGLAATTESINQLVKQLVTKGITVTAGGATTPATQTGGMPPPA